MSRLSIWLCLSVTGLMYWGFVHGFASMALDHFAAPMWFGGISLLLHWLMNPAVPVTHEAQKETPHD
ncbi:MAG: hypothetical protein K0S48_24 [Ramlibacter sp.]|jgi:hypothetical protein|nr:hypothetical protein [Ramlibacter sp.]